jgi:hypothetical protein
MRQEITPRGRMRPPLSIQQHKPHPTQQQHLALRLTSRRRIPRGIQTTAGITNKACAPLYSPLPRVGRAGVGRSA